MEGQNDIVVEKIFEDFQVSGDTWEVGYHIGKTFTGNGYATEAVKAFLPVIMKELNITEIFGICVVENMASAKVLEKDKNASVKYHHERNLEQFLLER